MGYVVRSLPCIPERLQSLLNEMKQAGFERIDWKIEPGYGTYPEGCDSNVMVVAWREGPVCVEPDCLGTPLYDVLPQRCPHHLRIAEQKREEMDAATASTTGTDAFDPFADRGAGS